MYEPRAILARLLLIIVVVTTFSASKKRVLSSSVKLRISLRTYFAAALNLVVYALPSASITLQTSIEYATEVLGGVLANKAPILIRSGREGSAINSVIHTYDIFYTSSAISTILKTISICLCGSSTMSQGLSITDV